MKLRFFARDLLLPDRVDLTRTLRAFTLARVRLCERDELVRQPLP